jgi:lysozyme
MNPVPRVIDISHHQTIPDDFEETKAAGVIAVIHKLTEGSSYVDDKVQARYYLAKEAGLAWGIYHFLRPSGDMRSQADFFISTARSLSVADDDTCYVADHEDQGVSGMQLKQFLDRVEDMTGHSPVVYSGHVIKEQLAGSGYRPKRRLWLAQYCDAPPELPEGVGAYWLWQFSQECEVPGIVPPTDGNWFEGDTKPFLESWAGVSRPPHPKPKPDVPVVQMIITADKPVMLHIEGDENVDVIFD